MPLTDEILGTNADGSKNEEYCIYCFKDGAFTGDFTMEEMIEFCSQFVEQYNKDSGQNLTQEEYKAMLRQYYPNLKRWSTPTDQLPHANSPLKQKFIDEVNALNIPDMPVIDNLFVLQGSFISLEYKMNGNSFFVLDKDKSYWGTQVEKLGYFLFPLLSNENQLTTLYLPCLVTLAFKGKIKSGCLAAQTARSITTVHLILTIYIAIPASWTYLRASVPRIPVGIYAPVLRHYLRLSTTISASAPSLPYSDTRMSFSSQAIP